MPSNIASLYRAPGFRRKLTLAFGTVILVVAMTLPVAMLAFNDIQKTSQQATRSARTLQKVGEFQRRIGRLRIFARDFARTNAPKDRNNLKTELNNLTDDARCISAPEKCVAAERDSYTSLPESERMAWLALIDRSAEAHEQFRSRVDSGNTQLGVLEFDDLMRTEVERPADRLAKQVSERVAEAQDEIEQQILTSAALLLMVLVLALIVASVLAWFIPRSLMRRLDHLRSSAHQIAGGDLSARVVDSGVGADEIAELIGDFNIMAKSLQLREDENRTLQLQLQQSLLNEQERATRDPLTSLRNHRYFQDSLRAEIDRCTRSGAFVTIAMLDLDNFKQVNDRFGHHEGDAVLLRVTKGITDNLRPYDLACRLGGEEFGVIFPETDASEAQMVLDRIAEHVIGFGPNGERATFSAGITTFPVHASNQAELYQRADEAAYTAKANGKAQSVIYDPYNVVAMDSEERIKQRSREAVMTTATTLVSAVDQKDPYTRHHSELTAIYAATLSRALGLDEENVKLVYRCGLLHDVGKIGIADPILKKPGRLTDEEFTQIKMHSEFSYRILETAEMEPIATWVRHHHEHWNGSGYPFGLSGEDIPLGSRIVLVADAFEAMTSDRVYRRALSTRQAVEELLDNSGSQFDPQIVHVMVDLIASGVFDEVRQQYGRPVDQADRQLAALLVAQRNPHSRAAAELSLQQQPPLPSNHDIASMHSPAGAGAPPPPSLLPPDAADPYAA